MLCVDIFNIYWVSPYQFMVGWNKNRSTQAIAPSIFWYRTHVCTMYINIYIWILPSHAPTLWHRPQLAHYFLIYFPIKFPCLWTANFFVLIKFMFVSMKFPQNSSFNAVSPLESSPSSRWVVNSEMVANSLMEFVLTILHFGVEWKMNNVLCIMAWRTHTSRCQ